MKRNTEVFGLNPKEGHGYFVAIPLGLYDNVGVLRRDELRVLLEPEVFMVMI